MIFIDIRVSLWVCVFLFLLRVNKVYKQDHLPETVEGEKTQ
jgi:hypothetical protein